MMISQTFEGSRKVKIEKNVLTCSFLSVFPYIAKIASFWWKNAHVSRNQAVWPVIFIFIGSLLAKVWQCQVSSFWDLCHRFQVASVSNLERPILNKVNPKGTLPYQVKALKVLYCQIFVFWFYITLTFVVIVCYIPI